jgi:neutral ceramidase
MPHGRHSDNWFQFKMPMSNHTRRRFLTDTLNAPLLGAFAASHLQGQQGDKPIRTLQAGAATANITPFLGSSLAGNMTDIKAAEIHDELQVRGLVLDDGQNKLAFAVVDCCVMPRSVADRAKELIQARTGIPATHVMVSATHTHSAPPTAHLFQSLPDPSYTGSLAIRIADCVQLASARRRPARISWGVGREERLVFNRRYFMKPGTEWRDPFGALDEVKTNPGIGNPNVVRPAGPIDPDVAVLAVEGIDGRPISVITSYALHYIGDVGPRHVSADYFSVWGNSLTKLIQQSRPGVSMEGFVPILTNACSGDINNVNVLGPKRAPTPPYQHMHDVADTLASESHRVWRELRWQDWVPLRASVEELTLATRLPNPHEVTEARSLLAAMQGQPLTKVREIYARETVLLHEGFAPEATMPVQAMSIGNLGLSMIPAEMFASSGMELKKKSPLETTMMIGLANDYRGYIPSPEAMRQGGYETWRAKSSHLEPAGAPKVMAAALRQLTVVRQA